jgi:hypothetical protein
LSTLSIPCLPFPPASWSSRRNRRRCGGLQATLAIYPLSSAIASPPRTPTPPHRLSKVGKALPSFPRMPPAVAESPFRQQPPAGAPHLTLSPPPPFPHPRRMASAGLHPLSHSLCAGGLMDFFPWKAEFSTPFTPLWSTGSLWRPSTVAVTVFPSPGLQHPHSLSALPFTVTAGCFARGRHPVPNPLFRAVKPFCTRQSPVFTLASLPAPTFPHPDTVLIDWSIKDRRAQGGGARS